MRDSENEGFVNKTNVERITNAFFGFTMTLLIRNLAVPPSGWETNAALVNAIARYFVDLGTYLFVFLVLAVSWVLIFRIYRNIVKVDIGFVARVFIALLFVVFLPVTSQVDAVIDAPIGGIFSELNLGLLGVMVWVLFRYASVHPSLRDPRLTGPHITRLLRREYLVIPGLSAIALILSIQEVLLAGLVYFVAPFLLWGMMRYDGLDRCD
jgi:uncharacterized membrane protein